MKRWPDLISLLRRRRRRSTAPAEKVALQLRSPTCSSRSSRTRPRRSSRTRRSSSSMPTTRTRSASSSRCTRSAATGRSWSRVHQREIEKLADAGERKAPPHRGREARLGEAEEAADLDRSLAQVLDRGRRELRGARRAREAVRAREGVGRSRRGAAEVRSPSPTTPTKRAGDPDQARHPLHREGPGQRPRHRRVAGAALGGAREPPRAGRAEEAVSAAARLERAREASTPPRASGTSWCACSSARPRPRTTPRASACGTRSASSIAIGSARPTARRRRSRRRCRSTRRTRSRRWR